MFYFYPSLVIEELTLLEYILYVLSLFLGVTITSFVILKALKSNYVTSFLFLGKIKKR